MILKKEGKGTGGVLFLVAAGALCAVAILGVFAFLLFLSLKEGLFSEQAQRSVELLAWIVMGIDLAVCIAAWLLKFESEDAMSKEKASELHDAQKREGALEAADYALELFTLLTFVFLGIRVFICGWGSAAGICKTILLAVLLAVLWISRRSLSRISGRPRLGQKADLHDEAVIRERMIAYRSGYRTYRLTLRVLACGMVLLLILVQTGGLSPGLFVEAGLLYVIMSGIFRFEKHRLRKKATHKKL